VAVSYAISLPLTLNWLVRCTAEAESGMNAVERAKYYSDELPQEAEPKQPKADERMQKPRSALLPPGASSSSIAAHTREHARPLEWAGEGAIEFTHVRMRYRPGLPEVLKGVSFSIKARERIGIVGRTGSGKSSLMGVLYRLIELDSRGEGGVIRIDGVDISTLGLDFLRSSMAIIAQDAVLFVGTVRSNLDPFDAATDEEVWQVLERAHLAEAIRALKGQLDEPVAEGGENFSVGQRSQLTLARAMLRVQHGARILIMDEATASIDMATDSLIQLSLRRDFADRTLLTIAHRLHTIIDYDRVLVC
jgi:ABC-type multidrug transport system fused ATPase/permease subunit